MKHLIILLSLLSIFGCSGDKQIDTNTKSESIKVIEQEAVEQPNNEFIKYPTVVQMLNESYDFTEENGSLKVLSEEGEPLHIQISKPIFDGDPENIIKEQTMRDIVYVTFQSFAQTEIDELTITSIPMKEKGKYIEKYKMSVTISRDKAMNILTKYLNTNNFQKLFNLNGTLWLPNDNFSILKFQKLNEVFSDLKQ